MNLMQFLGVICAKNLRESGSPPWGAPLNIMILVGVEGDEIYCFTLGILRRIDIMSIMINYYNELLM